jgi:hypothetical protein
VASVGIGAKGVKLGFGVGVAVGGTVVGGGVTGRGVAVVVRKVVGAGMAVEIDLQPLNQNTAKAQ